MVKNQSFTSKYRKNITKFFEHLNSRIPIFNKIGCLGISTSINKALEILRVDSKEYCVKFEPPIELEFQKTKITKSDNESLKLSIGGKLEFSDKNP